MKKLLLICFAVALSHSAFGAVARLQVDTKTHVLTAEDGGTIIDATGVTLTLGGVTISDASGVKTIVLGSTSGTKIGATGDKVGFLGAAPIVRQTGNIFTALTAFGLVTSPSLTIANVTSLQSSLDAKANDSAVVHTSGFNALGDARYPQMSGGYVNPSWLTSLPFSKLTAAPVSLSGYGITDPVALTNSTNSFGPLQTFNSVASSSLTASQLANPGAPTVTGIGTHAATTWTYKIVAKLSDGTPSAAGSAGSVTNGDDVLDSTNKNSLTWTAVTGAATYDVYRTAVGVSPSTTGKIANVSTNAYVDTGAAGDSSLPPVYNTTGRVTGAIADNGGQVFNVKAAPFNAKGDGITDDTAAIQAAIAAAGAVNGTVYLPPTYAGSPYIVSTLNVNVGVKITGGDAATNGTRLQTSANTTLLNITVTCTIENLSIVGSAEIGKTAQDLIVITDANGVHIRNCFITHGYNLVRYQGTCFYCYLDKVRFGESINSALRTAGSGASGQQVQLHGCNFIGGGVRTNYVMLLDNVGSIMMTGCIINHANTANGGIVLNTVATNYGGFRMTGCDVELEDGAANGPAFAIVGGSGSATPKNVQISNSYFGGGNLGGTYAVEISYLTQSSFTNCIFTAPARGIHFLKEITGVTFTACDFPIVDLPVVSDGASGTAVIDRVSFIGCKYVGSPAFLTLSPATVGNLTVRDSSIGNSTSNIAMPAWSSGKRVLFSNCWIGDGANTYTVFVQYPWTAATLINSWANLGGADQTAAYSKDELGRVSLRGIVSGGTTTPNTAMFVLPAGFTPPKTEYFRTTNGNQVKVDSAGNVALDIAPTGAVSLSGISFGTN